MRPSKYSKYNYEKLNLTSEKILLLKNFEKETHEIIKNHIFSFAEKNSNRYFELVEEWPNDRIEDLEVIKEVDINNNQIIGLEISPIVMHGAGYPTIPNSIKKFNNLERLIIKGVDYGGLSILPDVIGDLIFLKYLDISGNILKNLPDSICKFSNLEHFDVSQNELESLPDSIGNLKKLFFLDIRYNRLKNLPNSFESLKELQTLKMSGNKINQFPQKLLLFDNLRHLEIDTIDLPDRILSSIPKKFGNSLRELVIFSSKIDRYPNLMKKFNNLEKLDLSYGKNLDGFYKTSKFLPKLKELYLNYIRETKIPNLNKLNSLIKLDIAHSMLYSYNVVPPDELTCLPSLEILNLRNNSLENLSGSLSNLKSLKTLDLSFNKLISLPSSLKTLKKLEKVDLSHNNFSRLPDILTNLPTLKELYLNIIHLEKLDESINNLESLEILEINGNQLSSLPNIKLKSLKKLSIAQNHLNEIPESIGYSQSLKWLDLTYNNLKILPDSIGNLKNLEVLLLNFNNINHIPETLKDLTSLQYVEFHNPVVKKSKMHKILNDLENMGVKISGYYLK